VNLELTVGLYTKRRVSLIRFYPERDCGRYRRIKPDFFVRDYWHARVENNLLGSGNFARFPGFARRALAKLLKRAAASQAVVL
jgi:hypothetical protein